MTGANSQRSSATLASNSDRALVYTSSAARRKDNLASFVERSRGSPETAASLRQMLASVDVIGEMQRAIEPVGLSVSNVADAYAVWWMSSWGAAHGDPTTPNRATAQAVRAQAARAIMAMPEFGRADDAAKQEYAEALIVQAAMIDGLLERYRTDPVMGPKVAASARQGARASGLDLDTMTLTERGFIAVK